MKKLFYLLFAALPIISRAAPPPSGFVAADSLAKWTTDSEITIETIRVSTRPPDHNVSEVRMGVSTLDIEQIRAMPMLLGEVDVVKAIQMMPGVQMTSEGGSGFSVRGGSPDQNLILLDNAVVYNPSHLMGFFSVFNNDFVSSAELYKGDMPLKQGGRLSSLLEVNTLDRQPARFSGSGGIGLISSRVMLEGPIGPNTSWHVAARRSYADMFLPLAKDEELKKATLYFYDVNAKLTHRFRNKKDMLQLSGYYGADAFGLRRIGKINYGNGAASLTWRHRYNERLISYLIFNFSDYSYFMESTIDGFDASWRSGIRDLGLRMDFEHDINRYFKLTYGLSSTWHTFAPGQPTAAAVPDLPKVLGGGALEHAVYFSNEQQFGPRVTFRYGVRVSAFQNMGETEVWTYDDEYNAVSSVYRSKGEIYRTQWAAEPRVGVVIRTGKHNSLKASYAYNSQFIQLANNSASGSPLDVWFSAGPNIAPQRSHLASIGFFQNLRDNMFALSAELYYRDLRGVIDFRDGAQLLLTGGKLDGEVRTGRGYSYGVEVSVAKEQGAWTGFINYTWSRSRRTIPGINGGVAYPAPFDKTHVLNVSLAWKVSPNWELGLSWVYSTGNPTNYPTGKFRIDGRDIPIFGPRNSDRLPDYHRMDFSATWHMSVKSKRRWKSSLNFSVYNLYNRKNPWMVSLRHDSSVGQNYAEMTYLFGVVPSITYNFKF